MFLPIIYLSYEPFIFVIQLNGIWVQPPQLPVYQTYEHPSLPVYGNGPFEERREGEESLLLYSLEERYQNLGTQLNKKSFERISHNLWVDRCDILLLRYYVGYTAAVIRVSNRLYTCGLPVIVYARCHTCHNIARTVL